jgi:hypothetical protein
VTTREKPFLEMDAGEQREFLTQALADWIDAGFWSLPRSNAFHRRVTILERRIGIGRTSLPDQFRGRGQDGARTAGWGSPWMKTGRHAETAVAARAEAEESPADRVAGHTPFDSIAGTPVEAFLAGERFAAARRGSDGRDGTGGGR